MNTRWTDEELEILKSNYGKIKIDKLQELLPNRSRATIHKRAQLIGVKGNMSVAQRKYYFNEDYFNKPNKENCYWAGYIAADGNIGNEGMVNLTSKDKDVLEKFKEHINFTGNIRTIKRNDRIYYEIELYGAYSIQENLLKYWNITQRKSNTLNAPNLEDQSLILSFIIGYFDGDGTAYISKNIYYFGFCGTKLLMEWINKQIYNLCQENNINCNLRTIKRNGKSIHNKRIMWTGKKGRTIRDLLKNKIDIDWKMKRKWLID